MCFLWTSQHLTNYRPKKTNGDRKSWCPTPHCRVLPPNKFTIITSEPLRLYLPLPLPLALSSSRVGVSCSALRPLIVGPMRIPSATRGQQNLFVAFSSRNGSTYAAPQVAWGMLWNGIAQHCPKKWNKVSSFSPHNGYSGSSGIFITVGCLLSVMWPVRPIRILSSRLVRPKAKVRVETIPPAGSHQWLLQPFFHKVAWLQRHKHRILITVPRKLLLNLPCWCNSAIIAKTSGILALVKVLSNFLNVLSN